MQNSSIEFVDEKRSPAHIRFAIAVFLPNVGVNSENPPIKLALNKVKKEAEKVAFKYNQLDHWDYYCGLWINKSSDVNGKPACIIRMAYSTFNEADARVELIKYIREINILCNIESTMLYFNADTACEIQNSSETFYKIKHKASCNINAGLVVSGRALYEPVKNNTNYLNKIGAELISVPILLYASHPDVSSCKMESVYVLPDFNNTYRESIEKELRESQLNFTDFTIL